MPAFSDLEVGEKNKKEILIENILCKKKKGLSLPKINLQVSVEGSRRLNVAQRVDKAVYVSGNLATGFKPSHGGKLLPNSKGSVRVEQQTNGGHADLGSIGNVSSQTDQQRMNLILMLIN